MWMNPSRPEVVSGVSVSVGSAVPMLVHVEPALSDPRIRSLAARVEVLGKLPEYVTVTGYRVTPVVGLVTPPLDLRLDEFEVAEVFEVPLTFLLDSENHQRNSVTHDGRQRQYYAVPYRQYYIWGATAGMLMNLVSFLTD